MRWSLMPAWWKKSPKEVPATFNARGTSNIVAIAERICNTASAGAGVRTWSNTLGNAGGTACSRLRSL